MISEIRNPGTARSTSTGAWSRHRRPGRGRGEQAQARTHHDSRSGPRAPRSAGSGWFRGRHGQKRPGPGGRCRTSARRWVPGTFARNAGDGVEAAEQGREQAQPSTTASGATVSQKPASAARCASCRGLRPVQPRWLSVSGSSARGGLLRSTVRRSRGSLSCSFRVSGREGAGRPVRSGLEDAGIQQRIDQVDDQVHDDECGAVSSTSPAPAATSWAVTDLQDHLAQAGAGEDRLGDHRTCQAGCRR